MFFSFSSSSWIFNVQILYTKEYFLLGQIVLVTAWKTLVIACYLLKIFFEVKVSILVCVIYNAIIENFKQFAPLHLLRGLGTFKRIGVWVADGSYIYKYSSIQSQRRVQSIHRFRESSAPDPIRGFFDI